MGIAAGAMIETSKNLKDVEAKNYLLKLMNKKFDGYICTTVRGINGIEEGLVLLEKGKITLSSYEYFWYDKKVVAEDALKRSLNSFNAPLGVMDVFSLTPQQVKLVKTLKEDCVLEIPVTKDKLKIPSAFSYEYEKKLGGKEVQEITREELLERYGLAGLKAPSTTKEMLMYRAKKEAEDIEKSRR